MRAIRLIARRDWLATICSPTGLLVVVLYLVVAGYVFWLNVSLTQEATLRYTFASLGIITAFVVPLITMRLLSEELRSGTFEVLTAHPVSDLQIVLGKFLAGYLAFLALSVPTLAYVIILQVLGSPDWGPALSAYLGQQLLAVMLLAMGLLASSVTSNQVLAAMSAMIGGILLWLAGTAVYSVQGLPGEALGYLAMFEHFSLFRRGVVDTRALTYFLATAAMFLYLAVRAVESRRWKFGVLPGGPSSGWRFRRLSIVLLIVAAVILAQAFVSSVGHGMWTVYNTSLAVVGVVVAGTPGYLNRVRLRYELSRRRLGLVLTVAANSLLVILIWALVTYFTSRHYVRLDATSSKHYALSEQTRKVLDQLTSPVEIAVIKVGSAGLDQEIMDLLDEYAAHSPRVSVRAIDPIRSPGDVEQIQQRYELTTAPSREVLVATGEQFRRLPVASLINRKAMVVNGQRVVGPIQFVGEAEITAAIIQMTRKTPGRITFLAGHGEHDPDNQDKQGLSFVASELRRSGWTVDKHIVTPGAGAALPTETSVVVIAGPRQRLADEDLQALQAVLDRGASVLILADPGASTGLEPLLRAWDVILTDDIVVDLRDHVASADPTSLYITHFKQDDPIGKGMGTLAAVLPSARRIAVNLSRGNPNVFTSNFMHTSGDGWAVTLPKDGKLQIDRKRDRRGPISLGIACERSQEFPEPGRPLLRGRLVVIGDSDFITNHHVDMAGNLNLLLNCVDWLAGREDLVSVRPKVTDVRQMALTPRATSMVFWLSVFVVPGMAFLSGLLIISRRRARA